MCVDALFEFSPEQTVAACRSLGMCSKEVLEATRLDLRRGTRVNPALQANLSISPSVPCRRQRINAEYVLRIVFSSDAAGDTQLVLHQHIVYTSLVDGMTTYPAYDC